MTIIDDSAARRATQEIASVPRDDGGPVFREPWEAQAFALALMLHKSGVFTWREWTAALSEQIAAAGDSGEPDSDGYYRCWLATLEKLAIEKHLATAAELSARKDAWDRAARETPHGKPIRLPG